MYEKIEGGSVVDIQGLQCNLPPEGYVYNIITKKVILYLLRTQHTDIIISDNDLKDYKLMIIDQHANLLYVQHNQSISFGKYNYDILDIQSEIEIAGDLLLEHIDN